MIVTEKSIINFCFSLIATNLGLDEMPAELDASGYMLEEKPHPNLNGVVVHTALDPSKARPQITCALS